MEKQNFKYSAFISYKHADKKYAIWLQNKLENYRLPSKMCEELNLPKKLNLCFRDVTDLTGGILQDSIIEEMKQCKYMVVICSPNMYNNSKYVDFEVESFRKIRGDDYIIPFIIDGEVGADETKNPFPTAIKNNEHDYLGVNIGQDGKRKSYLKVIAKILGLSADDLIKREDKRRKKKIAIISSLCTVAFFVTLSTWLYVKPYENNYLDYVLVYNEPKGIYEITDEQAKSESAYYRITTQMGKTIETEYVNSYGTLIDNSDTILGDRPTKAVYSYSGDCISSVEYFSMYDISLYTLQFSNNSVEKALCYDSVNPSEPYRINSDIDSMFAEMNDFIKNSPQSNITGYKYVYDENGYISQQLFLRNSEEFPACTDELIYGYEFIYDELGRVVGKYYLNAKHDYTVNKSGVYSTLYTYDDAKVINVSYKDMQNMLVESDLGCASVDIIYEDNNKKNILYNKENEISVSLKYGFAIQQSEYDEKGNEIEIHFFDEKGELSSNLAYKKISYDDKGHMILEEYFDSQNQPCKVNSFEKREYTYYDNGIMKSMILSNVSSDEYVEIHYVYDENWNKTSQELYDCDGNLSAFEEYNYYYAIEKTEYKNGKPIRRSYLDENNELMFNRWAGCSAMTMEYDNTSTNPIRYTYYDENNEVSNQQPFVFTVEESLENLKNAGSDLVNQEGIEEFLEKSMLEQLKNITEIAITEVRYTNGMISYMAYYNENEEKTVGFGDTHKIEIEKEYRNDSKLEETSTYYDVNDYIVSQNIDLYNYNGSVEIKTVIYYEDNKKDSSIVYYYNESGVQIKREQYLYNEYSDAILNSTTIYDEYEREIEIYGPIQSEDYGEINAITEYTYYDNNCEKTKTFTTETLEGEIIGVTVNTYNIIENPSLNTGYLGSVYSYEFTMYNNGIKESYSKKILDEESNIIHRFYEDYYKSGIKKSENESIDATENEPQIYISREYDEDGNIKEYSILKTYSNGTKEFSNTIYFDGKILFEGTTYYDADGNVIEEEE